MHRTHNGVRYIRTPVAPGSSCAGCAMWRWPVRKGEIPCMLGGHENPEALCVVPEPERCRYYIWVPNPEEEQDI